MLLPRPSSSLVALALLLGTLQVPAQAQQARPFPLSPIPSAGSGSDPNELVLAPDHGAIAALLELDRVCCRGHR